MGQRHSKSTLRNAIIFLNISADPIDLNDENFWSQIWLEDVSTTEEVVKSISIQEIRMLRDGSPKNFATLTYKMVERLYLATGTLCNTYSQQTAVINATKLLIRIIPCIFEDREWRNFFKNNSLSAFAETNKDNYELVYPKKGYDKRNYRAYLPHGIDISSDDFCANGTDDDSNETDVENLIDTDLIDNELVKDNDSTSTPIDSDRTTKSTNDSLDVSSVTNEDSTLMRTLIMAVCDLLFCPEFTVAPLKDKYLNSSIDNPPEDLKSLTTCDYVWEPGVGFESSANSTTHFDKSRSELIRVLLVCISTTLYQTPSSSIKRKNQWIEIFASKTNRHVLPLFTSLLNTVFNYGPSKLSPFNHLLTSHDSREELVELSIQILIATLDYQFDDEDAKQLFMGETKKKNLVVKGNLFVEYMSRIHKDEDYNFIIKGFVRLMNIRLESQGYLLGPTKHLNFEHELMILFWRICNLNKKFVKYLLGRNEILDIVVPILYHLNENFQDVGKTGVIHIGVFNLLILSGEREFGVKLNRPCQTTALTRLPVFVGSHADLMIIVFHKLILYGHNLHQLFDFLLTILVNISPYLKGLTMMASKCLIQLFEIFSSSFVIFTEPNHHQLVVFLLEIFNNLIQYQFDSNANLVYTMIKKNEVFQALADLPTSDRGIQKVLSRLIRKKQRHKEMMEKALTNQKTTDTDCGPTNGSSSDNDRIVCDQSDSPTSLSPECSNTSNIGATVSSRSNNQGCINSGSRVQQDSQLSGFKQGVSLVATPDIYHVTQAIHPFDSDNEATTQAFFGSDSQSLEPKAISFDDILDQTGSHDSPFAQVAEAKIVASQVDYLDPLMGITQTLDESMSIETDHEVSVAGKASTTNKLEGAPEPISSNESCKKWKPTGEWVKQWKQSLPLQTSLRMIEVLAPQMDRLKQDFNKQQIDDLEMIRFLQDGTLVGLLPVPHPILIRKYHTNDETTLWFRACTWGIIYVRNNMWASTKIRLIKIV